jgi:hypothetical protein
MEQPSIIDLTLLIPRHRSQTSAISDPNPAFARCFGTNTWTTQRSNHQRTQGRAFGKCHTFNFYSAHDHARGKRSTKSRELSLNASVFLRVISWIVP